MPPYMYPMILFENSEGPDQTGPDQTAVWFGPSLTAHDPIMKTRLYNFDPLKPHCYIVKLGFTGVYIIFLISAQNIDCGYSLEPPRLSA